MKNKSSVDKCDKLRNYINKDKSNKEIILLVTGAVLLSRIVMFIVFLYWKHKGDATGSIFDALWRWDSNWYRSIITDGYAIEPNGNELHNAANWAFFPLVPITLKAVEAITRIDINKVSSVVNTLAFTAALVVAYKYIVLTRKSNKQGFYLIMLAAFGPYTFYYSTIYTESFFVLFLMLSLYFLKKKQYILMGVSGMLLSATRNIGIFFVFAILTEYIIETIIKKDWSFKNIFRIFADKKLLFGTMIIPFGLFSYMAYLWYKCGDPLAFVRIQLGWGMSESVNPVVLVLKAFKNTDTIEFYYSLWAIWGMIMTYKLFKNKRFSEGMLALIFMIIPLSVRMASIPRYLVCVLLYSISFIDCIVDIKRDNKIILSIMLIILETILLLAWFSGLHFVI